jgi:hypothetical protein
MHIHVHCHTLQTTIIVAHLAYVMTNWLATDLLNFEVLKHELPIRV